MTNEEKELAGRFCGAEIGAEDFRSRLRPGVSDAGLPAILIGEALADRDASALELAIASLSRLGIRLPLESLESVLFETWHRSHEDIVRMIADLREPKAIPALVKMVHWVPDYLMWDMESRAMARKAVNGLGWLRDHPSALEELELLADSKWEVLRETAVRFLGEEFGKLESQSTFGQDNAGVLGIKTPSRIGPFSGFTDDENELASQLRYRKITAEEFISRFRPGISKHDLSTIFIEEALINRDAPTMEFSLSMIIRLRLQVSFESFLSVLYETWHNIHEDIVDILADLRNPNAIPTLVKMVHWTPDYLMHDTEFRAFSRKAVFGLGWLKEHSMAREELERIAESEWEYLRKTALRFLRNKL